ncbi:MAG: hypothetical protein M1486_00955 [Gammaproteobacteria bacterium]|nr:hypothetical protein [Gammaproteobacteria bacterium]
MTLSRKAQQVIDLVMEVKKTRRIDHSQVHWICNAQDTLNVNGEQAAEIWKALDHYERRMLLWIVTSISGFEALTFYLNFTLLTEEKEKIHQKVYDEVRYKELAPEFSRVNEIEQVLRTRTHELNEREKTIQ